MKAVINRLSFASSNEANALENRKQIGTCVVMTGNAVKMVGSAKDSSSSSDDEALKRCQEAVWDTQKRETIGTGHPKPSKRVVVAAHEHDGNELQVTQGFQSHVAKKLGQFLDSRLTDIQTDISVCKTPAECENDDGFLLFSTSVPGQPADDPPSAVRQRPIPSSSDSDSEMETRLKEAAVSLKDLLPSSSLVSSPTATAAPHSEKKKKKSSETEEDNVAQKKKKKKRRKKAEDAGSKHVDCGGSPCAQNNGEQGGSKQGHHKVKWKKKAA
ncbi:protein CUSTOS isoform X2 [Hippocampus zosterae]|uniref:protein CUSTOS isoform X2 n=1 Tax=Hippocampus zosterae TaxID=109293 RepID=UPI00223E2F7F|nr:protein CUSTOS isoform X2 [Hippocampus zosterae]